MRKSVWRSEASDKCSSAQEAALQASIFILTEYGPTCFGIREDGNRSNIQVRIGNTHSCSCPDFKKTSTELCKHICWVLLKKFRIPKEDPLSWQLGLVENDIDSLLRGYEQRSRRHLPPLPSKPAVGNGEDGESDGSLAQRKLEQDDICPVCQEDFFTRSRKPVTYCRFGCGNSVHMHCMKLWAEHQQTGETSGFRKLNKDEPISCPMCRGKFCSASALRLELLTTREYISNRSNVPVDKEISHSTSQSQQNVVGLPPLMSVMSIASASKSGSNTHGESVIGNLMTQPAHNLVSLNNINNFANPAPAVETAKDVRINLKKPKPGLQCLQCLAWFKKGQIVSQLPCRHMIHKSCVDENDLTCPVCRQEYFLPRSMITSSAPAVHAKKLNSTISANIDVAHKGNSTTIASTAQGRRMLSDGPHFIGDLVVGQMTQQPKLIKHPHRPIRSRLTNQSIKNHRNIGVDGDILLPSTFCLTATQVTRFAP